MIIEQGVVLMQRFWGFFVGFVVCGYGLLTIAGQNPVQLSPGWGSYPSQPLTISPDQLRHLLQTIPHNQPSQPHQFVFHVNSSSDSSSQANAVAKQEAVTIQKTSPAMSVKETLEQLLPSCKNWFSRYKYWIFMGTCCALYGGGYAIFTMINSFLLDHRHWCNWRLECSIHELMTIQPIQLQHELLHAIQLRYINPHEPTNFIQPLTHFLMDIDKEILFLERSVRLVNIIKSFHLSSLFPVGDNPEAAIEQKLNRIMYIRHLFSLWATEYKIGHAC